MKAGLFFRDTLHAIRQAVTALVGWLLGYPLTFIVPRDPGLTVVIGRRGNVFADNTKYFLIQARQTAGSNDRVIFLGNGKEMLDEIRGAGAEVCLHPTLRSLWLVARCSRIVMDMAEWFDYGVYPLSRGAETIQLWHGAPLKHIELAVFRKRLAKLSFPIRLLFAAQKNLLGRYPLYDTVVTTSTKFTDKAFRQSFRARRFAATGYPRNDILMVPTTENLARDPLFSVNVDQDVLQSIEQARASKLSVALYVPTFRSSNESPFDEALDLAALSRFADTNKLLLIIKLHPVMHGKYSLNEYMNLVDCSPLSDIYPVMARCDLLITDYSSIYLDFLLLNRPIVFFAYDLEHYLENERDMYFSYKEMTPGNLCQTQQELEQAVSTILKGECNDNFEKQRRELCRFTHDHLEPGAVTRLNDTLGHPG